MKEDRAKEKPATDVDLIHVDDWHVGRCLALRREQGCKRHKWSALGVVVEEKAEARRANQPARDA
jgi:hypothetical protein